MSHSRSSTLFFIPPVTKRRHEYWTRSLPGHLQITEQRHHQPPGANGYHENAGSLQRRRHLWLEKALSISAVFKNFNELFLYLLQQEIQSRHYVNDINITKWSITSGANRNPQFRNSDFVRIPIRNSDGQRLILSEKFGQPLSLMLFFREDHLYIHKWLFCEKLHMSNILKLPKLFWTQVNVNWYTLHQ